ncbi:response regulator [Massilia arenosa]|uniref:histidine kinase n=1 Tax=Zemynaea arenosa TaxID=2561931 RepID=A0A4Y9S774_9BURK|nr:ATP-binding protein [Massilia arenosa]TFW15885.1 response regulator [Massilia arenosa]
MNDASAPQDAGVADLAREVEDLRAQLQTCHEQLRRMDELREANEHLVLATMTAQDLREEAEATNRRQNEFLAMLAHELRNPLAPISMATALMEQMPGATPQLRHLQAVIGRQVDQMARLLDDLLDAARISSGKINLSIEPLLLADVVESAVEIVQPRIDERSQQLEVRIPEAPLLFDGDPVRLAQVFSNLIGNASKYSHDGAHIVIAAQAEDERLVVTVEDDGSGIAPEVIGHIFDLFTQGPRSLARSEGGLGVGLNVVRNLVQMHGGTVDAASAGPGQGSRFTVELPIRRNAKPVGPQHDPTGASGGRHRVLLVEDNLDACATLRDLLGFQGHQVSTAHDGVAGLAQALASMPDVIVCDIGLPGMDGYALMRELRSTLGARAPLGVALSGYGQPEDRARAMAAGFDHFFVKPVPPGTLMALLSSYRRGDPGAP